MRMILPSHVRIIENAWIARMAAKKMQSSQVALVLGSSIYLWGTSKQDFLANEKWVRHEMAHIAQYQQYGTIAFLCMYLWEWIRNGYYHNKFEVAARAAETGNGV
jgi:Domain of unknown function (DUF4157)